MDRLIGDQSCLNGRPACPLLELICGANLKQFHSCYSSKSQTIDCVWPQDLKYCLTRGHSRFGSYYIFNERSLCSCYTGYLLEDISVYQFWFVVKNLTHLSPSFSCRAFSIFYKVPNPRKR